ncbi:TonB-dependent receptor [Maribacter sp. 2307ULW6-5]|uniref:TonB-dependent receptor n=1 Tax=Maribacter sp. 2307ULW6-5 TaxID=3386275 RepID=UPI0039BCC1BB
MAHPRLSKFLLLGVLLATGWLGAQVKVTVPVLQLLETIRTQHNIQFNYESSLLEGLTARPFSGKPSLEKMLQWLENQTSLRFSKVGERVVTVTKAVTICGYLKDAQYAQVLPGATVQSGGTYTITDQNGYFELLVDTPQQEIRIDYLGFLPLKKSAAEFQQNECATVKMREELQQLSPVTLTGYLVRGIDKKADGSTVVDFSKFTLLPGLLEADVLQTVQALPGVQSVDESVSNINIRGGSHDQNLILWDDIKMYKSGHFFGLISSFNPQITKTALVMNNGTDVSYTDGVSGTINMQTDTRVQREFKGTIGFNFLSADAFVDIPMGEKSSVQVAARRSLDDVVRTPTYQNYFDRIVQETEVGQNERNVVNTDQRFTFYDTSLRWLYKPSERDALRVNFILLNNSLEFNETATLGAFSQTRQSSLLQYNIAGGIHYRRDWTDAFATVLHVYNTDYKLQGINANVLEQQRFLQENIVSETGTRLEGIWKKKNFQFKGGYHFVESEVTNVNDIDRPRFKRLNSDVIREHAVVGQVNYRNVEKGINLTTGARINYIEKFHLFLAEPRISLHKKLGKYIEMSLLGEFKHQNNSQIINFQNDFLGIERRRWQQTDNDSIPILQSQQLSLGLNYNKNGWLLDLTGYHKNVDGITTQSQAFTTKYEFTRAKGSYAVRGLDVLLRKKWGQLSSWLSYSYMDNQYTFDTLEEVQFPSNFDIAHALTFGSTYATKAWHFSVGLNYRSGAPTSRPEPGNEVVGNSINFGEANSVRLRDYLRLDASMLYKFQLSQGLRTELGASVWNLTNRENTINNFYRVGAANQADEFSRFSLGLTTNFMLRVYF